MDGDQGMAAVRPTDRAVRTGAGRDDACAGVLMTRPSFAAPLLGLVLAVAAIVIAIKAVLRLPGLPYNVGELFLNRASLPSLVFFSLSLLWVGAGSMVVADMVRRSRRAYLSLPFALVLVSLISKILLSRSVTYESVDDIIGSNDLFG